MNRRNFVVSLGASLGGMSLASEVANAQKPPAQSKNLAGRRPNIILMICDDIGYGDLNCYGSRLKTPNLNRMASEGLRFIHWNSAHPICSASRSALLTGRYATRTGTNPVYFPGDTDGMGLDETTLANILHDGQYKSMCVGKWHLGHEPEYLPTSRGFDSYLGVPYSVDMRPLPLIRDKHIVEKKADRATLTPQYTKAAVEFIESSLNEPFFLYMAYSYPHIPVDASPRFKGKSKLGIYGDAIEEIDWSVGEILHTLQRNHLDESTLVIFTGDHGPWYQGSPGPLRGRKGTTGEGGYRVPLIARWTGSIPAGGTSGEWATHLDLLPTLASICGVSLPAKPLDGADVSCLFAGGRRPNPDRTTLCFAGMRGGFDLQCARKGNWKLRIAQYTKETYVLGSDCGESLLLARPELYDLDDDPEESYDIADLHPELVKEMTHEIDQLISGFPERVVTTYDKLKKNLDSPTTPAGAAARYRSYVAGPNHYDGNPS